MGCLELWDGWSIVETVEDVVRPCGIPVHRFGITARSNDGMFVSGSAATIGTDAALRGRGELLERAAIIDATRSPMDSVLLRDRDHRGTRRTSWAEVYPESENPDCQRYAKSNGVALAENWAHACDRAAMELVERDRVLRSWFGLPGAPQKKPLPLAVLDRVPGYDWMCLELLDEDSDISVVAAVGLPNEPGIPLVRGFGADASASKAVERAERECLQSLGFLAADDIPASKPAVVPTPTYHLDAYLWPRGVAALRAWLDPASLRSKRPARARRRLRLDAIEYVDMTPPALVGAACVAKAVCADAVPLVFGAGHPDLLGPVDDVPVHPIA